MAESEEESILRNPKFHLVEMLRVLTHFYSYRDLEEILEVPMQTLWKYATYRTVPEKETALRLLGRIRETGILEDTIRRNITLSEDPLMMLSNPGLLELATFMTADLVKGYKITTVVSGPDSYSAAFASLIAAKYKIRLCLSTGMLYTSDSICSNAYSNGFVIPICVSKGCVWKRQRILVVVAKQVPGSIKALIQLLKKTGSTIGGILIYYGNREMIESEVKEELQSNSIPVYVLAKSDRNKIFQHKRIGSQAKDKGRI
jgi:hypothetical protein